MITGITIALETRLFLLSLALGIGLSLVYDILRIFRLRTKHTAGSISLEDLLYFILSGFVTIWFLMKYHFGQVRGYILLGETLGWVFWHLTFGELLCRMMCRVMDWTEKLLHIFWLPMRAILRGIRRCAGWIGAFFKMILKKVYQKGKYNLKQTEGMLYNLCKRFHNTRE